ncbi:MAG: ComF family protein [Brevinema sp.]
MIIDPYEKEFLINTIPINILGNLSGKLGVELKNFKKDPNNVPNDLLKSLHEWFTTRSFDIITWIPSSRYTHTMKWFAQKISEFHSIRLVDTILFTRIVKEQKLIQSFEERFDNIHSAFQLDISKISKEDRIILIDDVYASGATIKEALYMFQKQGFTNIQVLIFVYRE